MRATENFNSFSATKQWKISVQSNFFENLDHEESLNV